MQETQCLDSDDQLRVSPHKVIGISLKPQVEVFVEENLKPRLDPYVI